MTDLHDRSFPVNADVKASVSLDFSGTGLSDSDAFTFLARSSDQFDLGLVKLAPDLGADQSGQVLVPLGDIRLPERVQRFGDQPDAIVKDAATLEHSFASGQYLVSGSDDQLNTFRELLDRRNIGNEWALDSVTTTLTFLVRQSAFGVTLLATAILMISLALFWLTVKSRARALRILAGVSSARIQYEDITEFLVRLSAAAAAVWALATGYVGVAHGWAFTAYYSRTLALFMGLVVVTTAICMLLMCLAAWPSPQLLARREPAVSKYRAPSAALKAVTFILLLSAVAPSVTAYEQASNVAAQQAVWRSLSDQVSLVLPSAVDEAGFQALSGRIGDVIADAEAQHHLALSYTWAADADAGLNFGQEQNLSLVNQQWLDLVTTGSTVDQILLTPVAADELPPGMRNYLQANLPIWLHPTVPVAQALQQFTFYRQSGTTEAPMARAGGGGIAFLDSGVVMVAPRVHGMFTDDFLGSVASSMNLMFTGLGPTQQLL
ncbi:hypothetical protein, partial [Intrasporangium sp.]|uniref:hypothetical protein n=1 Tax=Intrasporangium sp. TaxID=1925024 RepID=UPI0033655B08